MYLETYQYSMRVGHTDLSKQSSHGGQETGQHNREHADGNPPDFLGAAVVR